MKIEITEEEIMSIPNNMMLGEYVRQKLLESLQKKIEEEKKDLTK